MHNQAPIPRRKSKRIYVGNVPIGDGAPIAVQSMTNTRNGQSDQSVRTCGRRHCPRFRADNGCGRSV